MNEIELNLKSIANELANWEVRIDNLSTLNFYDANIIAENTVCKLLNIIFDYKLVNLNIKSNNHPAIDLGDDKNRIAYQITSTKSSRKIQKSLDTFFRSNLHRTYDEMFILILGKKQKKYSKFKCQDGFSHEVHRHILDFSDLLHTIKFLPSHKIKKINHLLLSENSNFQSQSNTTNENKVKRNLTLKKRLKKELLIDLDQNRKRQAIFEPYLRFNYQSIIIRSVEDDSFPKDSEIEGKISSWFKIDFWDFYNNGIEFIGGGERAIFDKDGYWDVLDSGGDKRKEDSKYNVYTFHSFYRIPYDYIVELDMEPDEYYGLPALYVKYAKDGMPYEEILAGITGSHEREKVTYYFDKNLRKKLS